MISDSPYPTKVAVWLTSYSLLSQKFASPTRVSLPFDTSVKFFTIHNQCAFAISSNGEVYTWGSFTQAEPTFFIKTLTFLQSPPTRLPGLNNIRISSLACNNTVALFLAEDGTVYSYGDDSSCKFGLLGLGETFVQTSPNPLSKLFDHRIKQVALGYSHACAVSSAGILFCWGSGNKGQLGFIGVERTNVPKRVNYKEMKCGSAVCSYNYTSVLSEDGKVFIYGTLRNSTLYYMKNRTLLESIDFLKSPVNHGAQLVMDLAKICIERIVPGEGFLACLSKRGEVGYVNEDLSVSWLASKHVINDIVSLENKIYGLAGEGLILYEWKPWLQDRTTSRFSEDYSTKIYKIHDTKVKYKGFCELPAAGGTTALYYEEICESPGKNIKETPPRLDLYELSTESQDSLEVTLNKRKTMRPFDLENVSPNRDYDIVLTETPVSQKCAASARYKTKVDLEGKLESVRRISDLLNSALVKTAWRQMKIQYEKIKLAKTLFKVAETIEKHAKMTIKANIMEKLCELHRYKVQEKLTKYCHALKRRGQRQALDKYRNSVKCFKAKSQAATKLFTALESLNAKTYSQNTQAAYHKITSYSKRQQSRLKQIRFGFKLLSSVCTKSLRCTFASFKTSTAIRKLQFQALHKIARLSATFKVHQAFKHLWTIAQETKKKKAASRFYKMMSRCVVSKAAKILSKNFKHLQEYSYAIFCKRTNEKKNAIRNMVKVYAKAKLVGGFGKWIAKTISAKKNKKKMENYRNGVSIICKLQRRYLRKTMGHFINELRVKSLLWEKEKELERKANAMKKKDSSHLIFNIVQNHLKSCFVILRKAPQPKPIPLPFSPPVESKPKLKSKRAINVAKIDLPLQPNSTKNYEKFFSKNVFPKPLDKVQETASSSDLFMNCTIYKIDTKKRKKEDLLPSQLTCFNSELIAPDNIKSKKRSNKKQLPVPSYTIDMTPLTERPHEPRRFNFPSQSKLLNMKRNVRAVSNAPKPLEEMSEPVELASSFTQKPKGRYNHKRFVQAFSTCFLKYYSVVLSEENKKKSGKENMGVRTNSHKALLDAVVEKKDIMKQYSTAISCPQTCHHKRNNAMPLMSARESYSTRAQSKFEVSPEDHISLNKKFVSAMSSINHELNAKLGEQVVPRFKVPKPELVFQLTRFKEKLNSKKGRSSEVSFV